MTKLEIQTQLSKPAPKRRITKKQADRFEAFKKMINGAVDRLNDLRLEYHIETVRVTGETIEVDYCPKGEEMSDDPVMYQDDIDIDKFREYVEFNGLNDFCNDYANHSGEHVQETGTVPFEYFIEDGDNLKSAVAEYLREGGDTIL